VEVLLLVGAFLEALGGKPGRVKASISDLVEGEGKLRGRVHEKGGSKISEGIKNSEKIRIYRFWEGIQGSIRRDKGVQREKPTTGPLSNPT